MGDDFLAAALTYAKLGLSVLPLHGKRPYFENWYEVGSKDEGTVTKWWKQHPEDNIGILTGVKSNLFVLDIDPRSGGDGSLEELVRQHGAMPRTWEVLTGGNGRHFYFRYPNFKVGNLVGLYPGIDIKGDGGQVVAPPSIHPETFKRYAWDGTEEITSEPLSDAPLWLIDLLSNRLSPKNQAFVPASPIPLKIPKGVQHMTLVSLAGRLRTMGMEEDEIDHMLQFVNERRCEEPKTSAHVRRISASMGKYPIHDRALYVEAHKLWHAWDHYNRLLKNKQDEIQKDRESLHAVTGYELMANAPEGPVMIIGEVLLNGLTMLAGRPKSGKSWLALQTALSVATGSDLAGMLKVLRPGRVGYFALEEAPSRTSDRLQKLTRKDITLQNIDFMYHIKPLMSGGLAQLDDYLERFHPNLLIIDTFLALVQGGRKEKGNIMRNEYEEIKALQDLTIKYECAILLVAHTNKNAGAVGIDAIAGTTGITAAADCFWLLRRQPEGKCQVDVIGREVEESIYLMKFDLAAGLGWQVLETGEDAATSLERMEILELLRDEGARTPAQIAMSLRKNSSTIRNLLRKMYSVGSVLKQNNGTYVASAK